MYFYFTVQASVSLILHGLYDCDVNVRFCDMWSSELSPLSSDAAGETYLPISAGTEAETRLTTEALIVMMAGKSKYYIAELIEFRFRIFYELDI